MIRRPSLGLLGATLLLFLLTALPTPAAVAVAVTNYNTTGSACSTTSGPSIAITPSGSDRLLYVWESHFDASADAVTAIHVNGSPITLRHTVDIAGGNIEANAAYLVAPAASSLTLQATYSNAVDGDCVIGAVAFSGVDQAVPLGTLVTAGPQNTTSCQVAPSGGDGDGMVLQAAFGNGGTLSWSHTNHWEKENIDGGNQSGGMQTTTGAGATMIATLGTSGANACVGEVIRAATGGGGGGTPPRLALLGVGTW